MARGTLEIDSEKHLSDVLGELEFRHLAGVNHAAPLDSLDKPLGFSGRVNQLAHKLVVGLVVPQGEVEPGSYLFSAAVDVAGPLIIVAKEIVPKGQPVVGIGPPVVEELADQALALVSRRVGQEGVKLVRRRQQT